MTTRALVLGGGGPVGIAWEAGLAAGLLEGGVDLSRADYILGTSAGSFVGSQLAAGRDPGAMAAAILAEEQRGKSAADSGEPPASGGARAPGGNTNMMTLMKLMQEAANGKRSGEEVRKELGAFALGAQTVDEETFIKSFGRSLSEGGDGAWPEHHFACTAVDTATGAFQVWDNSTGVPLAKAVASSCSVPGVYPPITINGKRYMDGGMRSGTNADLAKGHDKVILVAVRIGAGDPAALERSKAALDKEIKVLTDAGAEVEVITPDEASAAAFGNNLMNARVRPAAARAGLEQGRALAAKLKAFWN